MLSPIYPPPRSPIWASPMPPCRWGRGPLTTPPLPPPPLARLGPLSIVTMPSVAVRRPTARGVPGPALAAPQRGRTSSTRAIALPTLVTAMPLVHLACGLRPTLCSHQSWPLVGHSSTQPRLAAAPTRLRSAATTPPGWDGAAFTSKLIQSPARSSVCCPCRRALLHAVVALSAGGTVAGTSSRARG